MAEYLAWVSTAAGVASFMVANVLYFSPPGNTTKHAVIYWSTTALSAIVIIGCVIAAPPPSFLLSGLGATVCLIAVTIFWWAVVTTWSRKLRSITSKFEPVYLVTDGPYSYVRHPIYLSYMTFVLGLIIATQSPVLVPILLIFSTFYYKNAKYEERLFQATGLADSYQEYRLSTGMFFPMPDRVMSSRWGFSNLSEGKPLLVIFSWYALCLGLLIWSLEPFFN